MPRSRQLLRRWASEPGIASAHSSNIVARTPTPENTSSGLVSVAAPPITGPRSTPNSAAPSAPPIACPRRSGAVTPISHASAPAHVHAPPTPWTKRAASSTPILSAWPKATLVAAISDSPVTAVALAPMRPASQPAGSEATSVPAG